MDSAKFKEIRQSLGWSQADFASELGAATNSVARWERGEIPIPGPVSKLAELFASGRAGQPRFTGAARDEHHQTILDRLCGRLDPVVFEACAADLLRPLYPHLVPIRGGTDDGFDGEHAKPNGEVEPLIVTTARNYKSNLNKSLRRATKVAEFSHAIFATSQRVSSRNRQALRKLARELGIPALDVYDQDWFGGTLYNRADWAKELLGVTGRPAALSPFSIDASRRHALPELVGREAEIEWLAKEKRDIVLQGGPGFGKTALLEVFARQVGGMFLVDHDREALANAIRALDPKVVIVDDAYVRRDALNALVQLRSECGARFQIVACCWPCHVPHVKRLLARDAVSVVSLDRVDADTIVEIVKLAGVQGPVQLIRLIVNQAEGRPGLAVTLARLCSTSFEDVWSGQALFEQLCPTFEAELDRDVARLLGCFGMGGNRGLQPEIVAEFLLQPLDQVVQALAALEHAGVIRVEIDGCVSVWPLPFRFTLVREAFFGKARLPFEPLLERAPDHLAAVDTLIGARSRGATVSGLEQAVLAANAAVTWSHYALLGSDEARFTLRNASCPLTEIAEPLLAALPEETIPKLLQLAEGGHADALKPLKPWAREHERLDVMVERSKILVETIARRYDGKGAPSIAIHALCLALNPSFELTSTDPGQGRTMTFTVGAMHGEHLEQLAQLWATVRRVLAESPEVPWDQILDLANEWRCLDPRFQLDSDTLRVKAAFAERVARDLLVLAGDHAGVKHRVRDLARWMDVPVDVEIGGEFEVLFPSSRLVGEVDWEEEQRQQVAVAEELGRAWEAYTPDAVAHRINVCVRQAEEAKVHAPKMVHVAVRTLAAIVSAPRTHMERFVELGQTPELVAPFAERVAAQDLLGVVEYLLTASGYEKLALELLLRSDSTDLPLLDRCLEREPDAANAVEWSWYTERPETVVRHLLMHANGRIALAAATHEFRRGDRAQSRPGVAREWREAILRSVHLEGHGELYWLQDVLLRDASLAHDWLCVLVGSDSPPSYRLVDVAKKLVGVLGEDQRASVLARLRGRGLLHELVGRLVGNSADLYRTLLRNEEAKRFHLAPLATTPNDQWAQRIILAHAAGHDPIELAGATFPRMRTWSGPESDYWKPLADAFGRFVNHPSSCVRIVAEDGLRRVRAWIDNALRRERIEAIRGLSAE